VIDSNYVESNDCLSGEKDKLAWFGENGENNTQPLEV